MSDSEDAEYRDHVKMWRRFTRTVTYSTIVVVLILSGMAVTLL